MFVISLLSCSRSNAKFKFDQSVFAIHDSPLHILRSVRMTTHGRWTIAMRPRLLLNFRAFLFPDVNSRAELIPSPRAFDRNAVCSGITP